MLYVNQKKLEKIVMSKWKLCYVEGNFAYFTTQELSEQQGDDWDNVPYENNAGEPYYPKEGDDWEILKVAYEGKFYLPHEEFSIGCSVEHINSGIIAWLSTSKYETPEHGYISIPAGVPLYEFIELIKKGGGQVYIPLKEGFDLKDCYRGCADDK